MKRNRASAGPASRRRRLARLLATPRGVGAIGGTRLGGAVLAAVLFNLQIFPRAMTPASVAAPGPGSQTAFTYLAQRHSNFCQLQQAMVISYPDDMRLQGACCNPLDIAKYQHQIIDLANGCGGKLGTSTTPSVSSTSGSK